MSEYANIRIADPKTGTTLYWFCPAEITDFVAKNNIFAADRAQGKGSVAIDKRLYRTELVIQGTAIPSSEMQPDHRAAVQSLFGRTNVTPRMQIRWLNALAQYVGGAYHLYAYEDRYDASDVSDISYTDVLGHTYPPVSFDEFRYNPEAGKERIAYMVKFIVGFPKSSGSGA